MACREPGIIENLQEGTIRMISRRMLLALMMWASVCPMARAQEQETGAPPAAKSDKPAATAEQSTTDQFKESTEKLATQTTEEVKKIADVVDHDPRAKTAAAGILQPIYSVAESLAFPAFHWLAFALMSAGVVSFALQLVLGKLVVLSRLGFSLQEILSDLFGLLISVVGLVLTTQAAAENSSFTQSPAAVLSSAVLGLILGFILYRWGQAQELQAAAGRSVAAVATPAKKS